MPTRAQASRDAALRRLARVNRALAIVAVVGTGVITDVVANTASGQTRNNTKQASDAPAANTPELPVSDGTSRSQARKAAAARHRAAAAVRRHAAADRKRAQTSSATTPSVSAASSTAPVVAVSGGS